MTQQDASDDDKAYDEFEAAIERQLGADLKSNPDVCVALWSALANVNWYHTEKHYEVSYSFRAAGHMIARIIGRGDYMDWYCSGPYAVVDNHIAHALKKEGWIYDDIGPICDTPGCIRSAGCGWPSPWGYRHTCGDHMREQELKWKIKDDTTKVQDTKTT